MEKIVVINEAAQETKGHNGNQSESGKGQIWHRR